MQADVKITQLSHGLRVVSSRMPHVESLSFGVWVEAGGRYEAEPFSGVSHLIEHMLFKGTRRRSSRDISEAIEGRGGYFNAFTQEESTCYYARVASNELRRVVDVLADMYMHSEFDPGELNRERGVIIEEIMMYRDQPQQVVQEMLGLAVWRNHPLGRPLTGTPESLQALTRGRILDYLRCRYTARNTVLAFAGKVDHDRCVREVEKRFGALRQTRPPAAHPVERSVRQDRFSLQQKDIEQVHLAMGFRVFGREDPRRYALRILSAILGENMSSRLFRVIREKHGLAYSIHSAVQLFEDTGVLVVGAGLDRKRHGDAVSLIFRELRKMKQHPVGQAELRRARDYAVGQIRLGWESTSNQMMWVGDNVLTRNRFVSPDEVVESLQAVTAREVHALAQWVMDSARLSLAMVYPELKDGEKSRMEDSVHGL